CVPLPFAAAALRVDEPRTGADRRDARRALPGSRRICAEDGMSEILQVLNLVKRFEIGGGWLGSPKKTVRAVNDVSFSVMRGQSLGLVGESGCGKSTVARALLRLVEPDAGTIRFDGTDLRAADAAQLRALRRRIQMVFQDPYASLNPRRTVRQTLAE